MPTGKPTEKPSSYPIGMEVFTGPHSNKYIPGYASGTYVYATINAALEACENRYDCGGVPQELTDRYTLRNGVELIYSATALTSWLKRVFTGPHSNTYIIEGYTSGTHVYATINLALEACKNRCDCGGVVQESTDIYTLRNGGILIDWWETSWPSWLKISTTSC
jgi:hypothetical protein